MSTLPLPPTSIPHPTGLSFNLANYNTAIVDYSVRLGNTMTMGTLHLYYDHVAYLNTVGHNAIPAIEFSPGMWANRFQLAYTNTSDTAATFNYSIRLWNTI